MNELLIHFPPPGYIRRRYGYAGYPREATSYPVYEHHGRGGDRGPGGYDRGYDSRGYGRGGGRRPDPYMGGGRGGR